ncbi:MAG: hypothetical protein KDA80_17905 [Planctomycetaceae bacterium]|nr:hypothetical protein [Planctomycetaceae bacterium]
MIRCECDCGRALKVKDEHGGKRIRCPDCGQAVQVPLGDEDFRNDWDGMGSPSFAKRPPRTKASSQKKKRKKKSSAGSGWGAKQMLGGLILAFGVLLLVGILYMAVAEGFEPRALRGLVLPFAMIGMGIAWMKGETFGD